MLPETFPISGDALRNWLNTAGQFILLQFDTGASALDFCHSEGMQIRTSDFYNIYHAVWERYDQQFHMGDIPGNSLIPIADTITDHGWDLSSNYLYRYRVNGIDPETGEPVEQYLAIGSRIQLTPNEAEAQLNGLLAGQEWAYGIESPRYALTGAYARPGLW